MTVYSDLKFFGLVPLFGAMGAAATAAMWQVFSLTLMELTPPPYAVLGCAVAGLFGPLTVCLAVWISTRKRPALRWPAGVGLGMVLATELAFYVPLGFMTAAFQQA